MHAYPLFMGSIQNRRKDLHENVIDNHTDHEVTKAPTQQLDSLPTHISKGRHFVFIPLIGPFSTKLFCLFTCLYLYYTLCVQPCLFNNSWMRILQLNLNKFVLLCIAIW